jgi:hypothetical protein
MTIKPEYLVDKRGARRSVVLPVRQFNGLMEYLEELEDALDLKKARVSAKGFEELSSLKNRLIKGKRLS